MDEENKKKQTTGDSGEGDKSKKATLIDEANAAAKRLEEANERKSELLKQEEELNAKRILGGGSEAGGEPEKPKEETPKEYADKVMRGEVPSE